MAFKISVPPPPPLPQSPNSPSSQSELSTSLYTPSSVRGYVSPPPRRQSPQPPPPKQQNAILSQRMISSIDKIQVPRTHHPPSEQDITTMLRSAKQTYTTIKQLTDIIPKLHQSQQTQHETRNRLVDILRSTYISSAELDNPFSNPDDPFVESCHALANELGKYERIEKDYLQKLENHFLKPIDEFYDTQYTELLTLQSKYKQLVQERTKNDQEPGQQAVSNEGEQHHDAAPKMEQKEEELKEHELDACKHQLNAELDRVRQAQNTELLQHLQIYWNSFIHLQQTRSSIISQSRLVKEDYDIDGKQGSDDVDTEGKFEVDFDLDSIDEKVGFNDIANDMLKFTVKRIQEPSKQQQAKTKNKRSTPRAANSKSSMKYNRVIYLDQTDANHKKLKLLSLKKHIREYSFREIEKVEKSFMSPYHLTLKFKDKKEYHYEFESPQKREQFVGHVLEYSEYKENKLLSIVIASWNVGESECTREHIKHWLSPSTVKFQHHDLYVIGLQEVKTKLKKQWINNLHAFIDDTQNEYVVLHSKFLMSIGIIIIVHQSHIAKISHVQSQTVATGKGNIIGNKGAAAISFQFMETTFCFVNCHLAARAERFEKRAKNFMRIVKELKIGNIPNVDILHQFQHVFWFGDLNYRIEREFNQVLQLIAQRKWSEILEFDQLYHAMNFDDVFSGFTEGKITFCPTYRWDRKENKVSNKRNQPPSYTDRILYRSLPNSLSLWQETYNSYPNCFGSDHRPILSVFRFKPRIPYFAHSFRRKYSGVTISFVELKAQIKNAKVDYAKDGGVDIVYHFLYSDPSQHTLKGGQYDTATCYFRWPMIELDDLKIEPFVSDPSFLCTTHLSLSFVQKGNVLGYSVISLFNAFPKTLLDTNKLKQEYMLTNMQMDTMKSINIARSRVDNAQSMMPNHKAFKITISNEGSPVGELEGFISVDGKTIRKHLRYSAMDARRQAASTPTSHSLQQRRAQSRTRIFSDRYRRINQGDKLIQALRTQSMMNLGSVHTHPQKHRSNNRNHHHNSNNNNNNNGYYQYSQTPPVGHVLHIPNEDDEDDDY